MTLYLWNHFGLIQQKLSALLTIVKLRTSMSHTVHVVCDPTEFDEGVTVAEDALVRDLLIEAGVTNPLETLTYSLRYYQNTQPISVGILLQSHKSPTEKPCSSTEENDELVHNSAIQ